MKFFYLVTLLCILSIQIICAQTIDENFKEPVLIRPAKIQCIKVLSNGKILTGGDIAFFNNRPVNNLIRLNSDSTIDETFNFKGISSLIIMRIEFQSTGDIIVLAQGYEPVTETYKMNFSLFQLDSNGEIKRQIDTLENPGSIAVQDDDKVLVCGGGSNGYLYRYNSDLTVDNLFNHRVSFNNQVTDIKFKDNKLFVSGNFSLVNDTVKNDIAKLTLNGFIDPTFDTGSGTDDLIGSLTIQNDDKILPGRSYINSFNGKSYKGMVRLNSDGTVDTGFIPPWLNGMTSDITVQDSSIIFASYLNINAAYGGYLVRLKSNGSMDNSFVPFKLDRSFDMYGFCLGFEKNRIIFNNSSFSGSKYGLSKCDSAGTLIKTFAPETGRYGVVSDGDYFNDKLIIAGDFIRVNGTETYNIAMINKDGSVDTSFVLSSNPGKVIQLKILNKDTCLVSSGPSFFKLDAKAQIQPDFNFHPFKTLYNVNKFIVLENRKIIVGDPNNIYRLNKNGTEDITFNIGTGIGGSICTGFDFDIQNDKVIYGSLFNKFNGTDVNRLVRLKSDASLDQTFDIGSGPDDLVSMIKVLKSGEIIVGGSFKHFNGIPIPHGIVKLSENGALNTLFNSHQLSSPFSGIQLSNVKVEQLDTTIFIQDATSVKALSINGTFINTFSMPFIINQIHDIVILKDGTQTGSYKKSTATADTRPFMFALGNFKRSDKTTPSFIIKLDIKSPALSISTGNLNITAMANSMATFDIASNISWHVSSDQTWLTVDKESGTYNSTITISALANTSSGARTATITVSGSGVGVTSKTLIVTQEGVSEVVDPDIKIYPSPVTNKMVILFSKLSPQTNISIYSLYGEQVFSTIINNMNTEVDMSHYVPGIYFFKITLMKKDIMTGKIIKQ